jgi:hypothetical protein
MADLIEKMQGLAANLQPKAERLVKKYTALLWRAFIDRMRGGTSSDTLGRRTGDLIQSTRPLDIENDGSKITGGVVVGEKYAVVHFGPKGSSYTIKPTNKQFLTVPLPAALTAAGVARGHMEGPPWTFLGMPTFIRKGVIFGKTGKDQIVPLFVLKASVTVPRRIDIQQDILDPMRPEFVADCRALVGEGQ